MGALEDSELVGAVAPERVILAAHQIAAADTLIEAPVDAGFRLRSLWQLPGASFHPRAAELQSVGPSLLLSNRYSSMDGENESLSKYAISMQWLGENSWKLLLLLGSCILAGWIWLMWLLPHWDYLPQWAPVPGPRLMWPLKCLQPIILCVLGVPTVGLFAGGLTVSIALLFRRIWRQRREGVIRLSIGLTVLIFAALPWFFGEVIDDVLVRYAISRYDAATDAIEQYHEDHGEYPPRLEALVPDYLPKVPGIYMKFGEVLKYDPNSEWGYVGYGPFTFELYGAYRGVHGQTLKYCPVEYASCSEFNRIDDRWVWAYSSAL